MALTLSQIDDAISACLTAVASGDAVVEYEVNGKRVKRSDPAAALKSLRELRRDVAPLEARKARGSISTLGSMTRPWET